ncbi:MAG: hypothetical protein J1G38_06115 [Clostridiales bacterium]|nr:hypothetical protein [Clostridiales bacterium]
MINIAKKKLPMPVMGLFVYLSYCAMSWYTMRGTMAYYGEQYGFGAWFANDVWAFFIGGIFPLIIYEVLTMFVFKTVTVKIGLKNDVASVRYGLCFAVIAANIVLFGLKFIYVAAPMYAGILNAILDPAVTFIFVGLYLWYAFSQNYVDKTVYRIVVSHVMGAFIAVYGVLAFISIIMTVGGVA